MQHIMAKRLLGGKLGLAPIDDKVHRVLDIGTGTGIWAIEFGKILQLPTQATCHK